MSEQARAIEQEGDGAVVDAGYVHVFAEDALLDGDALPGYEGDYLFVKLLGQRRLGCGEVDAQCKTLVQARYKQAYVGIQRPWNGCCECVVR